MDTKNNAQAKKAIQKAEQLLKEVHNANRHFLSATGKLGEKIEMHVARANTVWKKTEQDLKSTEREVGKEVESTIKDFFLEKA